MYFFGTLPSCVISIDNYLAFFYPDQKMIGIRILNISSFHLFVLDPLFHLGIAPGRLLQVRPRPRQLPLQPRLLIHHHLQPLVFHYQNSSLLPSRSGFLSSAQVLPCSSNVESRFRPLCQSKLDLNLFQSLTWNHLESAGISWHQLESAGISWNICHVFTIHTLDFSLTKTLI